MKSTGMHDIDEMLQELRSNLNEAENKAALYEKLRRMNPREFTELYRKNIETGVAFDELLDKWLE